MVMILHLPLDAALSPSRESNNPAAADRIQQLHDAIQLAKKNISEAQQSTGTLCKS